MFESCPAILLATTVRAFFDEAFDILPDRRSRRLLVGDCIFCPNAPPMDTAGASLRGGRQPRRGDVVICKLRRHGSGDYVKRVIGFPGDRVEVQDGIVNINGRASPQTPTGVYAGPEEPGPKPRYEPKLPNGVEHYVLHWSR